MKFIFNDKLSSRLLLNLLHSIWAIPAVLLIRIIRPWIYIRFGTLWSNRIGHFVTDSALRFAELSEKPSNQIELYWLEQQTSNKQWEKMVRRNFKVSWWVRHLDYWNKVIPGGEIHSRPLHTINLSRDINGDVERTKTSFQFLPEEDQIAKKWLREQGWQDGEPFVCLLIRDDRFLDTDPLLKEYKINWEYHSYRNTDISTYVPAMEWLADQGVWVLRMGKIMEKPIPSKHKRIIDYAFHSERSDFLDIWLFAHCNFCISSGTGLDTVSGNYRRPIFFINFIPIFHIWSWSNAIHVPKKLVWKKTSKELTCKEYLSNYFTKSNEYKNAGINIIDLTSKEILLSTQECWQRIEGKWIDNEEEVNKQKKFWRILKKSKDFSKCHGWKHPNSRIGSIWLQSRKDYFWNE